jgi:hypothetical protein
MLRTQSAVDCWMLMRGAAEVFLVGSWEAAGRCNTGPSQYSAR